MGFDLFIAFRWLLVLAVTVYSTLMIATAVWEIAQLLAGSDKHQRLLRAYLFHQVLTIRLRPAAGELTQIGCWLILLVIVWQLHRLV